MIAAEPKKLREKELKHLRSEKYTGNKHVQKLIGHIGWMLEEKRKVIIKNEILEDEAIVLRPLARQAVYYVMVKRHDIEPLSTAVDAYLSIPEQR